MLKAEVIKKTTVKEFINQKKIINNQLQLMWLGQAGFIFLFNGKYFLIDAYLSDFLSKKYKGTIYPHIRLIEPPILPENVYNIDYFLSTHAHTDHMDSETIRPISNNNLECKFITPSSELEEAIKRGMPNDRIITINAKQEIKIDDRISIIAVPSAHESLKVNDKGEHHFIGYIFKFQNLTLYHSGDCIPYKDLQKNLQKYAIDIALLPINGRDEKRFRNGIMGNFHPHEVLDLSQKLNIKHLIVHHFGMFAYNTVSDEELEKLENKSNDNLKITIPNMNIIYKFNLS